LLATTITVVVLGWTAWAFNRLTRNRNRSDAAWSDIDVQLQRRHDLIPQLVEAVRGYAGYERATLTAVTELRERSRRAERLADKAALEDQIEAGTRRLIALAEDYPDLKASENFLALQAELADIEDHLQYARRYYNGAVREQNTRVQTVPDVIVARLCGFGEREFFSADPEAARSVRIALD
jgi:LemA protein